MKSFALKTILIFTLLVSPVAAQTLQSPTYELIEPTIGTASGVATSTTYSQLYDTSVGNFTVSSVTYRTQGGLGEFIEANVPLVGCLETSTNSGTTDCTGLPGSDGMQAVCGEPGCYDRAKLEIDAQGNPVDARYAIQVSTSSDFSSNVYYVDATTRLLKSSLTIADFIPKCEWEGTTQAGVCVASNTTWQRYNILGLSSQTTYYVRVAAHRGFATNGGFTQSEWGPSANVLTQTSAISFNIDIAPDTSTSNSAPYLIALGTLNPSSVTTSSNMMVLKVSSNALSGVETQVKSLNDGLLHSGALDTIPAFSGDLGSSSEGIGIRNNSSSNSAQNSSTIGSIDVAASPIDYTDSGAAHKVGEVSSSFNLLFDSNSLPLDTGISGYYVKAKPTLASPAGNYSETFTFVVNGTF